MRSASQDVDERVRELLHERRLGPETNIPPSVVESWARSIRYGLDPSAVEPCSSIDYELDRRLIDAADTVMSSRSSNLDMTEGCLYLTNSAGIILRQWSGDSTLNNELRRLDVEPGFLVSETTLGTTSGCTLITGTPSFIRGPEHFGDQFVDYTSAGMTIAHPVLRRIVGSINLICRFRDTSPAALSWVCEIVRAIESALLDTSTQSEQLLMQGFLLENRDSRHPVVAVSERTVVTNTAAARMLGTVDQLLLWEYASHIATNPDQTADPFTLGDGSTATVRCRSIVNNNALVGIVMNLARSSPARTTRKTSASSVLKDLVGSTKAWNSMCERISRIGGASLLLVGEPGVGKSTIAQALAEPNSVTFDGADFQSDPAWIRRIEQALDNRSGTVLVLNIDQIPDQSASALAAVMARHQHINRIIGTSTESPPDLHTDESPLSQFVATIPVPSLKDRIGDLPSLVTHFTESARQERDNDSPVRWMSDALQALSRITWTDNLTGLERTVRQVVINTRFDYIGARDLPSNLAAQTSRRRLSKIERIEARAIVDALHNADGNKLRAAESLGIARSTLYRKLRSLGIDLTESTF